MATYAFARCGCGKLTKKRYNTERGAGVGLYHLKRKALACCGRVRESGTHSGYTYGVDAARALIAVARSLAGVRS